MYNDNIRKLSYMVLVIGTLLGLTGCSAISSKPIQKEEIIAPNVDDIATEYDIEGQDQDTKRSFETEGQNDGMGPKDNGEESIGLGEVEIVNAARFGNPKEVLDNSVFTSDVEVKKTGEDELEIVFELEYVGLCTFVASKGEEFVLPNEVFVDSSKIEWTAPTANGEYIFPYMRVNETGDMFMIDWTYNGYCFAIYGKSPQETSYRDTAGKVALEIISNLEEAE